LSTLPAQHNTTSDAGLTGRQWLILTVLSLTLAIVIIDASIVNVTIPAISREFHASIPDLQWISSSYALVYAALLITFGRLSDTLGRRLIFMTGIATFGIGSITVGASSGVAMIIVGRIIQGVGAAMASPSTLSILSVSFTGRSRSIAFGIWGATAGAGGALGPLLGGFFTTDFTWRLAFLINVPIAIAAIVGALLLIPESKDETSQHTLDLGGIVLASLGFAALVLGFIEAPTYGWVTPTTIPFTIGSLTWATTAAVSLSGIAFGFGVVALASFVAYELALTRRGREPLFDFRLLRYIGFRYGLLTVSVVALGEFGILFILSLYLQEVRNLSALDTGLLLLPFAGGAFLTAPIAGLLSAHVGPKWVISTGMLLEATAIFLISRVVQVNTPLGLFVPIFLLYGIGLGLAIAQLTNVVLSNIPPQFAGTGSGANNTLRQVGAAIGVAILGAILTSQAAAVSTSQLAQNTVIPAVVKPVIQELVNQGQPKDVILIVVGGVVSKINTELAKVQTIPHGGPPLLDETAILQSTATILNHAETQGTRSAGLFAALFVFLGAMCSLLIPNPERTGRRPGEDEIAAALGEWDLATPANTEPQEKIP
jgi:EmrB/QacA subfamily drug resistance transporter